MDKINLHDFLMEASLRHASDIYFIPGSSITLLIGGRTIHIGERLLASDTESLAHELYHLASRGDAENVFTKGDDNFSFAMPGVSRFRVSMFRQRNTYGTIIRMTPFDIPSPLALNIPDDVMELCDIENGLVMVTGLSGSGKTTTVACMLDRINHTRNGELIITLENPLEYVHRHANCIVTQREIYTDTASYEEALHAVRYQRAHVLMVSDLPTPSVALETLSIAQAGSLVLTTFHGTSVANALQNFLDMFSLDKQRMICAQLSSALKAVVFQRLIPSQDGSPVPAFEVVRIGDGLRALLMEGNILQIADAIASSKTRAMIPFDLSLANLFRAQRISYDTAIKYALDKNKIRRQLY